MYLTEWKFYDDITWETADTLRVGAKDALNDFNKKWSRKSVRAPQARRLEPAPEAHWEPQGTPDHSNRTKFIKRASRTRTRFNRSISIL